MTVCASRILVIGIDGIDSEVVDRLGADLPNMQRLGETTPPTHFVSTFPPDTTPAWATIHLGETPAEHGIINFVNPADRQDGYKPFVVDDSAFRGKTFWDRASAAGCSCCVVFPMNIGPGWDINGFMVVRPRKGSDPLVTHPEELAATLGALPTKLAGTEGFSSQSQLGELLRRFGEQTDEEHRVATKLFRSRPFDLFFAYYSALDGVQHSFWPFGDPEHILYPGPNEYEETISDFYKKMDRIVGEYLAMADEDTAVIVLGDHGHGARPTQVYNVNEALRREGLLFGRKTGVAGGTVRSARRALGKLIVRFVRRFGAGRTAMSLSKRFPLWKAALAPSADIDWETTAAYVSDLSTVKNYSYGGIRLNPAVAGENADGLIDRILERLREDTVPDGQGPVVTWAARREDLYEGPFIERFPEILIQLDERFGLGWQFGGDLFDEKGHMFQLTPGTHRMETPFFGCRGLPSGLIPERLDAAHIAPCILRTLGVTDESHLSAGERVTG